MAARSVGVVTQQKSKWLNRLLVVRRAASIEARLSLLVFGLVFGTALILAYVMGQRRATQYEGELQTRLVERSQQAKQQGAEFFRGIERDLLVLTGTPPIQAIIRAGENGGIDPLADDSESVWNDRLGQIFESLLREDSRYLQIRYVGLADNGREVVRVDQLNGRSHRVPQQQLQQKERRDYVQSAAQMSPREVRLSPVSINREHGKLQAPLQPVIRAWTPIYSPQGKLFGLLVLNVDASDLVNMIRQNQMNGEALISLVAAPDGSWLAHPELGYLYGNELGHSHGWHSEFPAVSIPDHSPAWTSQEDYFYSAMRLDFLAHSAGDELLLLHQFPKAVLFAAIHETQLTILLFALATATTVLLPMLWFIHLQLNPLSELTEKTREIAEGNYSVPMPRVRGGQMKGLTAGFIALQRALSEREAALKEHERELEEKVSSRTSQLMQTTQLAERHAQAKSEFLANMSHEIRTPMNAILGMTHLLARKSLDADSLSLVKKITSAGRLLQNVIDDILDLTKIEEGKIEIEKAPFDLLDVLDGLSTIMSTSAEHKNLDLVICPPNTLSTQVRGDATRLEQVLNNLVNNAVKFTDRGMVEVRVDQLRSSGPSQTRLAFTVRDTGIGIPDDKLESIFSAFQQADASTTRRFGGTGLGLSICRRLVELMGGTLTVQSKLGQGSEFAFELELDLAPSTSRFVHDLNDIEVLIADDHEESRVALDRVASQLGWKTLCAESGEKVLELAQTIPTRGRRVVLLDYVMPGMDGLQTASAIRKLFPKGESPIVLIATAFNREVLAENNARSCVDRVLEKPVTASSLYDAVAQLIQNHTTDSEMGLALVETSRLSGARLLIVDDVEINREVAQRIFESEGAQVHLCTDGQEAVDWLQLHHAEVDLVLMDVQMPHMDGLQATRFIREELGLTLPIVALTAGAFHEHQEAASEAGMNDFIPKPFNVDQTIGKVCQWALVKNDAPRTPVDTEQSDRILNTERGLRIWQENAEYHKWLKRFFEENGAERIDSQWNDSQSAHDYLHRVKGAAGNLGLMEVCQTAEAAIRRLNAKEAEEPIRSGMRQALENAEAAAERFIEKTRDSIAPAPRQANHGDSTPDGKEALSQLLQALNTDSPEAVESWLLALKPALNEQVWSQIWNDVENFDFRAAKLSVARLVEEADSKYA